MKRKMLLLVLAFPVIYCQNVHAQTGSRLIGMTHLVNGGSSYTPVDSTDYVYSGNRGGDLKHTLKYDNSTVWDYLGDTAYSNANMIQQTYDVNNNLLTSTSSFWSGTAWTLLTKNLYLYNTAGKDSLMIQQSWGGTSWVPVSQDAYYYVGGKLVEDQYQAWNGLTLTFTPTTQKNYYYDPVSGNKINETDLDVTSGPLNIKEYKRAYNYSSLPFDTFKSSIALFILEVISKSLKEHDAHEDMFQFVYDCFSHLDEIETMNNDFHLQFLVHYASYLGFAPHGEYSDDTPYFDMQEGTFIPQNTMSNLILDRNPSEIISILVSASILQPLSIRLNRQSRRDMLHHLLKYYSLHLEGFTGLRSPEVLEMIFD